MRKILNGFTLIEMVVAIGVIGFVMTSVLGVMTGTFRSQNKIKSIDKMNNSGVFAMRNIRQFLISGLSIGCPVSDVGTSSFAFADKFNGEITTIVCKENLMIASESARGGSIPLTTSDIQVVGCDNFAKCNTLNSPYNNVTSVDINFTLKVDASGVGITKPYSSKVSLR